MKRTSIITALLLVLMVSVTSCASTEKEMDIEPLNPNIPEWVMKDTSTADTLRVVGVGHCSVVANSMKVAEANARARIAEYISSDTEEIIHSYYNEAGSESYKDVVEAFEVVTRQTSSAMVRGARKENLYMKDDGTVYVLMAIPMANIKEEMTNAAVAAEAKVTDLSGIADKANGMMKEAVDRYYVRKSGNTENV